MRVVYMHAHGSDYVRVGGWGVVITGGHDF